MKNTAFKLLSSLILIATVAMMAQAIVLIIPAKAIEDT